MFTTGSKDSNIYNNISGVDVTKIVLCKKGLIKLEIFQGHMH